MGNSSTVETEKSTQSLKLRNFEFGSHHFGSFFTIEGGGDLRDALKFSSDLNDGLAQLLRRVADDVNEGGEEVFLSEARTLCFLATVSAAVTRAAQHALDADKGGSHESA